MKRIGIGLSDFKELIEEDFYAIIYLDYNLVKYNLRRYDSGAFYRCYFSTLKYYLRIIYDLRR